MNKFELRKKYSIERRKLSDKKIEALSLQIANNALELPIWDKYYYHLYLSIDEKKEVLTDFILHILQGKDKSVVVSKSNFDSLSMSHYLLQENTTIKVSEFGIPEPVSGIEIDPSLLDIVFAPLLAYDIKGNRLGYGKGFYDRFLSQCGDTAIFVGLSFFEPENEIAIDPRDVPLHYCVSPKKCHVF